jgi:hypothetical protein
MRAAAIAACAAGLWLVSACPFDPPKCPWPRPDLPLDVQMRLALHNGCPEDVRRILAAGLDLRDGDDDGEPWVLMAMQVHPAVNLPLLQAAGLNMSAPVPEYRGTPLQLALRRGRAEALDWLLSPRGANLSLTGAHLADAAADCRVDFLQRLVDAGVAQRATREEFAAAINRDMDSEHCRQACMDPDTATLLRLSDKPTTLPAKGAEVSTSMAVAPRVQHYVSPHTCAEVTLRTLLQCAPAGSVNERVRGWTALHRVAHRWDRTAVSLMDMLVSAGGDIDARTDSGDPVVTVVLSYAMTTKLLQLGARLPDDAFCQHTAPARNLAGLHHALRAQDAATGQRLLGLRCSDATGATPLMMSFGSHMSAAIACAWLQLGANVSARDTFGATALHYGLPYRQSPATLRSMLQAGARHDLDAQTASEPPGAAVWRKQAGQTPVIMAATLPDFAASLRELLGCRCDAAEVAQPANDPACPIPDHPAAWQPPLYFVPVQSMPADVSEVVDRVSCNGKASEAPWCPFRAWPLPASASQALRAALRHCNTAAVGVLVEAGAWVDGAAAEGCVEPVPDWLASTQAARGAGTPRWPEGLTAAHLRRLQEMG